jgi:hypothetical protein
MLTKTSPRTNDNPFMEAKKRGKNFIKENKKVVTSKQA